MDTLTHICSQNESTKGYTLTIGSYFKITFTAEISKVNSKTTHR